jgi:hypothetical protein
MTDIELPITLCNEENTLSAAKFHIARASRTFLVSQICQNRTAAGGDKLMVQFGGQLINATGH